MVNKEFKNRQLKRALCIAFAGMMMLGACGCGKRGLNVNEKNSEAADSKVAEAKNISEGTTFAETEFNGPSGEGGIVSSAGVGDSIYYVNNQYKLKEGVSSDSPDSMENYEVTSTISKFDVNSGEAKDIVQLTPKDGNFIRNLIKGADGSIYAMVFALESEAGKLCKIEDDKLVDVIDMANFGDDSNSDIPSSIEVVDKNGNYVINSDNGIKVYDKDSKELFSKQIQDGYIFGTVNTKDGDIAIYLEAYDSDSDKYNNKVIILGTEPYEVKKELPWEGMLSYSTPLIESSGDYDFLYRTRSDLFGYDIASDKSTKLVDFDNSDINSDNCSDIYMIDSNTFVIGENKYEGDSGEDCTFAFKKYSNKDVVDASDKTLLTYAVLYADGDLKNDIIDFNKSQDKYKIKLVDYSEEEDPYTKMSADIAAGNYPDIYDLNDGLGDISLNQAIEKGLFEDLSPYIEKDDAVNLDDLIPSVKNAIDKDGKCYFLPASFSLYTLAGKKADLGEESGWSYAEMKKYCADKKDSHPFYSDNKKDTLESLLDGCCNEFIDWEKGECSFDNQNFKDILEIANQGSNEEMNYDDGMSEMQKFADGKIMFMNGSLALENMSEHTDTYKGDIVIKGYPSADNSGSFISLKRMAAISSKSENKDAAWEFVRRYATEEFQGKHYQGFWGDPTRKDVYDVACETATATKETTDKYGNKVTPRNDSYVMDGYTVTLRPLKEEEVKTYTAAVEKAAGLWSSDHKVIEIISEEAGAYFAGDKSVDETVKLIENRVNTYINENK
ncbi:MAG: extracellular solute-binding protein [Eubacterium sp.]|nr:extracellular solute-binding protein [Eubacterium sp.]